MKSLVLGILVLTTMLSAHAAETMEAKLTRLLETKGTTHYDALAEILVNGVKKPSIEKLDGVALSGRCFHERNPNQPMNAGFTIKKQKGFFEAYLYNEPRGTEDFFDSMTVKEVMEWNPRLIPTDIAADFFAVDRPNGFSSFEQSGQYLVEEQTSFVQAPGRLFNRWVTTGHCYYLIPKGK